MTKLKLFLAAVAVIILLYCIFNCHVEGFNGRITDASMPRWTKDSWTKMLIDSRDPEKDEMFRLSSTYMDAVFQDSRIPNLYEDNYCCSVKTQIKHLPKTSNNYDFNVGFNCDNENDEE